MGVGIPFVSGSLKVANPAKADKTAKIVNVPGLKITQIVFKIPIRVAKCFLSENDSFKNPLIKMYNK